MSTKELQIYKTTELLDKFIYTAHSYKHVLKGYHTVCHISYYTTVYCIHIH